MSQFFQILSIKMTYFINFNDTLHKFLSIKTILFMYCDTIYKS